MISYSPNMLKTFEDCPKKFEYKYIKKIQMPQKASNFEKGKKIHALANYYLQGAELTKMEKALTQDEMTVWNTLKQNEFFNKTFVNSEYTLTAKIGEFWVGGRLDALMKDENCYYILDYKTGSIPKNPEYDFQTMVYLLCAKRILGNEILHAAQNDKFNLKFIYIDLKNNENKEIEFSRNREKEYENLILETCDRIAKNQYAQATPEKCAYCEYKKLCL